MKKATRKKFVIPNKQEWDNLNVEERSLYRLVSVLPLHVFRTFLTIFDSCLTPSTRTSIDVAGNVSMEGRQKKLLEVILKGESFSMIQVVGGLCILRTLEHFQTIAKRFKRDWERDAALYKKRIELLEKNMDSLDQAFTEVSDIAEGLSDFHDMDSMVADLIDELPV